MKRKTAINHSGVCVATVTVDRGYACCIEVVTQEHGTRSLGRRDGTMSRVYIAYYSPAVLANGWQPFDQPSLGAYMPLPFADFVREDVEGGGSVLVQRTPDEIPATLVRSPRRRERALTTELRTAFSEAGAPTAAADRTLAILERSMSKQAAA